MGEVVCVGEVLPCSPGQARPLVSCASTELHVFLSASAPSGQSLEIRQARMGWLGYFLPQIEGSMAETVCSPATGGLEPAGVGHVLSAHQIGCEKPQCLRLC